MITMSRDYWIQRAKQCRAFAASQSNDVVAKRMLEFARSYDALADTGGREYRPEDGGERTVRRREPISLSQQHPAQAATTMCEAL